MGKGYRTQDLANHVIQVISPMPCHKCSFPYSFGLCFSNQTCDSSDLELSTSGEEQSGLSIDGEG